jgi:hypothetical protein
MATRRELKQNLRTEKRGLRDLRQAQVDYGSKESKQAARGAQRGAIKDARQALRDRRDQRQPESAPKPTRRSLRVDKRAAADTFREARHAARNSGSAETLAELRGARSDFRASNEALQKRNARHVRRVVARYAR